MKPPLWLNWWKFHKKYQLNLKLQLLFPKFKIDDGCWFCIKYSVAIGKVIFGKNMQMFDHFPKNADLPKSRLSRPLLLLVEGPPSSTENTWKNTEKYWNVLNNTKHQNCRFAKVKRIKASLSPCWGASSPPHLKVGKHKNLPSTSPFINNQQFGKKYLLLWNMWSLIKMGLFVLKSYDSYCWIKIKFCVNPTV